MSYKVVCIREFVGMTSNGSIKMHIPLPVKDAIYTCVDEKFDDLGMHALILSELAFKGGYNSEYFAPLDDAGVRTNMVEQLLEI